MMIAQKKIYDSRKSVDYELNIIRLMQHESPGYNERFLIMR